MKAFLIVVDETNDKAPICMTGTGQVDANDLHGYSGIFVRNTICEVVEMKLMQRFALWLLGLEL